MQGNATAGTVLTRSDRVAVRAMLVVLLAIAVLATTAFVPADATSGGDDVESVRATVTQKYTHKINALTELKGQTDNAARKEIYQGGINELTSVRDTQVATEDDIEALWALKEHAHTIYNQTVAAAEAVPTSPAEQLAKAKKKANETISYKIDLLEKWIAGCDDPGAVAEVASGIAQLKALYGAVEGADTADDAYAVKDKAHQIYHATIDRAEKAKGEAEVEEKPPVKTEAEKAAEALARARRNALSVIERKTAVLASAAKAAKVPAVVDVYSNAADEVAGLEDDARAATTVAALGEIEAKAVAVYEGAKADAEALLADHGPETTLDNYLEHTVDYVTFVTQSAEDTAAASPETFAALVDAKNAVLQAVDAVGEVTETGNRLDARWEDLHDALRDFRRALIRHYIALGVPALIGNVHIPG